MGTGLGLGFRAYLSIFQFTFPYSMHSAYLGRTHCSCPVCRIVLNMAESLIQLLALVLLLALSISKEPHMVQASSMLDIRELEVVLKPRVSASTEDFSRNLSYP